MFIPLPLVLVGVIVILIILFLRRNYGVLENSGFPVVPPTLCLGSGPFMMHKTNLSNLDQERFEKYGKIWGAYQASSPQVFITDPDMIKQIHIKDFDSFNGHSFHFSQKFRMLTETRGEEWSQLRKGLSPIFSSGKIRGMMKHVDGVVDNMINYLNKKIISDPVIDMRPVYQYLTMDVISKCAFGVDLNCFEDTENPMLKNSIKLFKDFCAKDLSSSLQRTFEFTLVGLDKYIDFVPESMNALWNITRKIQESRAKENVFHGDFIDKLHELKAIVKDGVVTEDQLTAQGIVFMLAGFDTSANTLGSLTYCIVSNPQAYDLLMSEIQEKLEEFEGKVNHETVADMPYLDACIKETLRILPPVARNDRRCNKEWTYKGYKIKKETTVMIPIHVVHHNPEYWPEPELFKPERFFKENAGSIVPCSYLPFGAGPRACLGERFAQIEIKVAIVRLLQAYHLEKDEKTKLNLSNGDLFMNDYAEMFIKFVPREK